ncbi:MAG: hypothetical protein A2498_13035 [Lentisphaerae bacterium RIFOXYC12_FULL_60_16]|nr:MAG: hypothetical protein A2498_13035 [Lentisphaerae bacterium RIFOXYC12_FULL_60_16]OGV74020.1 MAG: hypothetical protein A2269_08830 [Lentisphaerae bacterium RIFOXYA12_FULL_60_10]
MNNIPIADTRNVAILGHTATGKTALVDALCLKLGLTDRLGSPANGSSMADYTDEEKARKISIFSKPFCGTTTTKSGRKMNLVFIDTPGYQDFYGQVLTACRAADSALVTIDAISRVQVGTRRSWKCAEKQGLARAIVITGLDRENAVYSETLDAIREAFGNRCVPVTIPDGAAVIDILAAKTIPDPIRELAEASKSQLMELAAETDDALIEKFLGGEELTPDELAAGLRKAVAQGSLVPVFACLPLKDTGITELLDGIHRFLPAPSEATHVDASGKPIDTSPSAPFMGQVWRTVNDSFSGQLAFVRVFGGTLKSDSELFNATKKAKERVGSLLVINGKKSSPAETATAGDIVAIAKLKSTGGRDSLCAVGSDILCPPIEFPKPIMFQALTAKTQADEDKLGTALQRVVEDDPTLEVERNKETKETILKALGDVHIDVAVSMMKSRSNVEVVLSTPKVPYRETVTALGEGHYKHKKQSGGRGQFGEVYLRVDPNPPGNEEWFVDAIVGGTIPGNFVPAVQKGVIEGMTKGGLAGYPVEHVRVTVYDGSYHEVDSSEIAFKIASSKAFREAMSKARPVLLEPIMTVHVSVPDQFLGDINGDINHKRGRILGMEPIDGGQVIQAEVPLTELFRYGAELRSVTGGQGSFEMEFCRYENVPTNVAQKIIASAVKHKEEETD